MNYIKTRAQNRNIIAQERYGKAKGHKHELADLRKKVKRKKITKMQTALKAAQRIVQMLKKKSKGHGRWDKNKQNEIKVNRWLKHIREKTLCL